jgi:hypothetical protein
MEESRLALVEKNRIAMKFQIPGDFPFESSLFDLMPGVKWSNSCETRAHSIVICHSYEI